MSPSFLSCTGLRLITLLPGEQSQTSNPQGHQYPNSLPRRYGLLSQESLCGLEGLVCVGLGLEPHFSRAPFCAFVSLSLSPLVSHFFLGQNATALLHHMPRDNIHEHGQEGLFSSCGFHHCPSALTGHQWGWGENDIGIVCLRGMSATRRVRAGQCSRLLAEVMEWPVQRPWGREE